MYGNYREAYAQAGTPTPPFGLTQQHDTAFTKFQIALQHSDEPIEEWAEYNWQSIFSNQRQASE